MQVPSNPMPDLKQYLPNGETPWRISSDVFQRLQDTDNTRSYQKCEVKGGDPEWIFIQRYFEAQKPDNRSIKRVYCIHNAASSRQFESTIPALEIEAGKTAFSPKWQQEGNAPLRKKVIDRWQAMTAPYSPFSISWPNARKDFFKNVKVLPLWHGTKAGICESICDTGFTYFGKQNLIHDGAGLDQNTDVGYFGSGIYFTNSARYAADIYSDGNLLLAWVSMREPYPVIADSICSFPDKPTDMKRLEGYGAYQNYNAHHVPVVPVDPSNKMCAVYYPCAVNQQPTLDEVVVFQKSQALASFWVELEIDLPKSIEEAKATVGVLLQKVLDLLENYAIQQDQEAANILEAKTEMLLMLNPNQALSTQEQEFLLWATQLLDTTGKVRGFVRKKLGQVPLNQQLSSQTHSIQSPLKQSILQPTVQLKISPTISNKSSNVISAQPKGSIINVTSPKIQPGISIIEPKVHFPAIAFGKAKWHKYFGYIGEEPPLPTDIHKILSSPCPFWPNKRVEETHVLVLIPASVNGKPLTMKSLDALVRAPKKGNGTFYRNDQSFYKYVDRPPSESYWVLMTKDVLDGTLDQSYATQVQFVKSYCLNTRIDYDVPLLLEATICLFMTYVSTGIFLYAGGNSTNNRRTYTRCQENFPEDFSSSCHLFSACVYHVQVGDFNSNGLHIQYSNSGCVDKYVGVAARREFF